MGTRLYVGNLPWSVGTEQLQVLFEAHGSVVDASVVTDRETGRSRGFGFVEMEAQDAAQAAIEALNDHEIEGRRIRVNEARERAPRRDRQW